ncbi:hypothetical protein HQ524_02015 [Candidatus Uhrbacteria bacterium]|nr:hypothetical protein [Candidatus Uhrbacteria bacterium]
MDPLSVLAQGAKKSRKWTQEDWKALIEAQVEAMKPFMESFQLSTLGDVKCMTGEEGLDPLSKSPELIESQLEIRGIFGFAADIPSGSGKSRGRGTVHLWCLSRELCWLQIEVKYTRYKGLNVAWTKRADAARVTRKDLNDVLEIRGVSAWKVWEQIVVYLGEERRRAARIISICDQTEFVDRALIARIETK